MINLPHDFTPKPDAEAKEQTIQEAVRIFRHAHEQKQSRTSLFVIPQQWTAFAAGALAMLAIVAITHVAMTPNVRLVQTAGNTNAIVLAEMQRVFGGRLEGIIQDDGNIQPVVSSGDIFAQSQPVLISLRIGDQDIRVITFSGSTVELTVGGQHIRLSPVISNDGGVIVEGNNFIWENGKTIGRSPASITAKPMELKL